MFYYSFLIKIKLFLCCLFLSTILFAQNYEQRKLVENSFVILKNKTNLLPLKQLDKKKLYLFSSNENANILLSSMKRYTRFYNKISEANMLIVPIFENDSATIGFLEDKLENKNYILCLFNILPKEKKLVNNAQAIVFSDKNDSLTADYCGQLLFGAFGIDKKIDKKILPSVYKNNGTKMSGNIRFKYTSADEAGLDENYILSKIDSIITSAIQIRATPGVQIFVAVNQKVILNKAYGFHTYDSIYPVKNTDLYDFASITKIAASAPAIMALEDIGKIDINQPISNYLLRLKFSNKSKITFRQALCHQARLTPWIPFWKATLTNDKQLSKKIFCSDSSKKFQLCVADKLYIKKNYKRKIIKIIKKSDLIDEKKYKYSDLSFYLYPDIVEKITKKKFENFLKCEFYAKLGANSLCFNPLNKFPLSEIVPTEKDKFFRKQLLHGHVHDEGAAMLGGISGHAGLFGNANDLAKIMQMFLNYGVYANEIYISPQIVEKWTSYQFKNLNNRRGIAFDKPLLKNKNKGTPSKEVSESSFGHTGFTGTFTWADPENGLIIVFLSNRVYPSRDNKKLLQQNIRTNIHDLIYQALKKRIK